MSADEDFSDELLALAGDGEVDSSRKKRRQSGLDRNGSAKRRRPNDTTDDDLESEDGGGLADPYPLEGKFKNEDDRDRLMDMNELEREEILAQRLEEKQRYVDSVKLEKMHKIATGQVTSDDEEAVSKAAKRKHTAVGTNKTKAKKLDELKAKRAAQTAKTKTRVESRHALSDSGSGSDMEESDEEEEGQVTRWDESEDQRQLSGGKKEKEKLRKEDLERIHLSRDTIEKWCYTSFFPELAKGCFVRFFLGPDDDGRPVYRVCEIDGFTDESTKTYKIQDTLFNRLAILKHSNMVKPFPLDRVSNSPFTDREFDRWLAQCETDKVAVPQLSFIIGKQRDIEKYQTHVPTETEITEMIARKNRITGKGSANLAYAEKSRLHQERNLAHARRDIAEVQRLDELIRSFESSSPAPATNEIQDSLAKVNERNRKANMERIRKAEAAEAEERRRHGGVKIVRKLHSGSTGNTPVLGPQDASKDSMPPLALDGGGLLTPEAGTPSGSQSPSPKKAPRLEAKLATSIDLDLGDF